MGLDSEMIVPFVSTFSGVFLGFVLGLLAEWFRTKTRENQQRSQTEESIASELQGVLKQLPDAIDLLAAQEGLLDEQRPHRPDNVPDVDLSADAKSSAVVSGRFALLQTDQQSKISHVYAAVDRARDYRSKMLDTLSGSINQVSFPVFNSRLKGELEHLRERLPKLLAVLNNWRRLM